MENVAILIDGAFFLKRAMHLYGALAPNHLADIVYKSAHAFVSKKKNRLYRIFFYDCPPLQTKIYHPYNRVQIDMSKSERSKWRLEFHNELKRRRKVALRLGVVDDVNVSWRINYKQIKKLCAGRIEWSSLTESDFSMDVKQKGVDMRIGIDITSLALEKQVTQIVLVSGDSDFVPAAKFARREGIDFILDPMKAPIKDDLHEHIDGIQTIFRKRKIHQ